MDGFDEGPGLRPARVLIGWIAPDEAVLMQSGRRDDDPRKPEYELRAAQARLVAAARRPVVEARGVITEPPASLRRYKDAFEASPRTGGLMPEGWRIALVDLRRVCAVQPYVFTDTELPDVDPGDLEAIAGITLQTPTDTSFQVQYHKERSAWIVPAGPQLKIVGEFQTEIEPGLTALGFTVRRFGSFLQVVRYQDRYVIRDGNHRALAFLARGINVVPALVSEAVSIEDVHLRRGMLPIDIVLGPRPPLLPDYLDDDVAAGVQLPVARRVLMIQGLDIPIFG